MLAARRCIGSLLAVGGLVSAVAAYRAGRDAAAPDAGMPRLREMALQHRMELYSLTGADPSRALQHVLTIPEMPIKLGHDIRDRREHDLRRNRL